MHKNEKIQFSQLCPLEIIVFTIEKELARGGGLHLGLGSELDQDSCQEETKLHLHQVASLQ